MRKLLIMKQTARIISIYASDTAGVCSMLYELGGMTVVHDASGCNSTYSTHDEPRWYQMDSMIYISGLTETDVILPKDFTSSFRSVIAFGEARIIESDEEKRAVMESYTKKYSPHEPQENADKKIAARFAAVAIIEIAITTAVAIVQIFLIFLILL